MASPTLGSTSSSIELPHALDQTRAKPKPSRPGVVSEAILGYLFVAPAAIAALLFQLIPVAYGLFLSTQGGIAFPEGFVGLTQFIQATGSLAFMLGLAIALVFAIMGISFLGRGFKAQSIASSDAGSRLPFVWFLIPAVIAAPATLVLIAMIFTGNYDQSVYPFTGLTVAILLYAFLMSQGRKTQTPVSFVVNSWIGVTLLLAAAVLVVFVAVELRNVAQPFLDMVQNAISQAVKDKKITAGNDKRFIYVVPIEKLFVAWGVFFVAGLGYWWLGRRIQRLKDSDVAEKNALQRTWLGLVRLVAIIAIVGSVVYILSGLELLRGSTALLAKVPPATLAQFTSFTPQQLTDAVQVYPQVMQVLLGTIMLGVAYFLWQAAMRRTTTLGLFSGVLIAISLIVGGWLFIGELPQAAASGDKAFYDSLLRTVAYAIGTVPIQLMLGLLIAYLLFYEIKWGKGMYRVVFFVPYIAPTVATAAVFSVVFAGNDNGVINQILKSLGIPVQQWLRDPRGIFEIIAAGGAPRAAGAPILPDFLVGPSLPLFTAMIYAIWVFSGYNAVIFFSGLGAVPKELYEAAQVDGAGRWASFRNITLPMISPTTFFLSVLAVVGTFRAFTHIYVLRTESARGAMDVATVYIYEIIRTPERNKSMPYAAALSFILFGIILILTIVQNRVTRDSVFYG